MLTPHIKSTTPELAKSVFEHVAKVVMHKLEMLASQEGLGLAYIQRKIVKRKSAMSCSQRQRPSNPLKEKGRRVPDNSLTRTKEEKEQETRLNGAEETEDPQKGS